MSGWDPWVSGVIAGIGEPDTQIGIDTHWAWSNAETAPYDLMRWNNPQNTTEKWPGSRDSGAQPGPHDVQIYRTIQDGIDATVWTLLNEPYYPAIVANLRAGLPRQQWGAYSSAGAELHAWGTGTNWLQATYGPAPGQLQGGSDLFKLVQGDNQSADPRGNAAYVSDGYVKRYISDPGALPGYAADLGPMVTWAQGMLNEIPEVTPGDFSAILAAIKAITPSTPVDLTAVLAAIADLKAHPAVVIDPTVLAIVTRIEGALKTA